MTQKLETVVQQATLGDIQAFETIVYRFQDMAVGYAYAVVGDFHLAEDVAQESFVQIYQDLTQLREPKAFPTWFRKVVYKQCDRMTRRKQLPSIHLETSTLIVDNQPSLSERIETSELQQRVHDAILSLPEGQRRVVTLYYISEYSQKEIAAFLDIPLTTVKKRLHDAKKRLKQRMTQMTKTYLHDNRPSKDSQFQDNVLDVIVPNRSKHGEAIYSLIEMGDNPHTFQWRAGRLAHGHVDWAASRIGCVQEEATTQVVTAMHVFDITMRIANARIRTAGFDCEATHPRYMDQRLDLITRTVTSSLDALRAQGYDLAVSFDNEDFWCSQGFVFGWRALQWHVGVADLPDAPSNLNLYTFDPIHRDDLAQVYNQTHQALTGTTERPTYLRNKHPGMFMGWYWTDAQGNPTGYISGGADRHFSLDLSLQADLDRGQINESVRRQFTEGSPWYNAPLTSDAICTVQNMGSQWLIEDKGRKCFIIKTDGHLQGVVFDKPLFWVDEVAGDPDTCLQALAILTRQWQCQEVFFDRLHYKSGVGKQLRQMNTCRIHTGTFSRSKRSYVVRIINLQSLLEKLTGVFTHRLQKSPLRNWQGNLLISLSENGQAETIMLTIENSTVAVAPISKSAHAIHGGQSLAQLVLGTETPDEIVEMTNIQLTGDAELLLPVLFPAQYPQMENQAL